MNPPITDWTSLPPNTSPLSLWECLHDATIQTLRSDRVACTLTVDLDVFYIREHHGLPDDLRFILRFEGVSSVRANVFAVWPGELSLPPGASPEERNRAIGEVQAKSREQSVSWSELETALEAEGVTFDIYAAELVEGENSVALRLQGYLDSEDYYELFIRAASLALSTSDGQGLTLQQFRQMGELYWDAFEQRRPNVKGD
jgi:hypothetical protein